MATTSPRFLLYRWQAGALKQKGFATNTSIYKGLLGVPYTTVCYCEYHIITPPWCGFPSSTARQPRGCQYRTMRTSSESSRRDASNAELFGTNTIPTAVEIPNIDHGKFGPGGAGVIYTVVCDIAMGCTYVTGMSEVK